MSEEQERIHKKENREEEMSPKQYESSLHSVVNTTPSSLYKTEIAWTNVILFIFVHVIGISGFLMYATPKLFIYGTIIGNIISFGITAGAHRLWCHRTYKARLPLRIFLMLMNCAMIQHNIYVWCRDHRVHHKFTETDADPYNSKRGFFFSHMGWLMVRKHPDVKEKGKTVNLSDVLADPVVTFQMKYYVPLCIVMSFIVPSLIPYFLWDVSLYACFSVLFCYRYVHSLHVTWLVNSAAHKWGYRPYDPTIGAVENLIVSFLANGEGFHNYHHSFPWDYSTSENGWGMNISTMFIDFMSWLGLAYDRKKASPELIEKFKKKFNSDNFIKSNEYTKSFS